MVLVIDPQIAGVSGDMLLCSLVDLGADKNKVIDGVRSCSKFLPGSTIQAIDFKKNDKNGISSVELVLQASEYGDERPGSDIQRAVVSSVEALNLSDRAKLFARSCIDTLLNSESKIHGTTVNSVHLHEASGIDTLVDIVGVAMSLDDLDLFAEDIVCMPIAVGGGSVEFSHGIMSNPASAVLEILKNSNLRICGNSAGGELTTPTGACMLKNLVTSSADFYPSMTVESIGYGSGQKNFESFSNVLKIVRGGAKHYHVESIRILETNVDDVSGEVIGGLVEKIMSKGALDISVYPGITKKNRPTNYVCVMCDDESLERIADVLIGETGTLGVRVGRSERLVVPYTIHDATVSIGGKIFDIRYKVSSFKGQTRLKVEFDDLQKISGSLNKSLREVEYLVRKEIEKDG